MKEIKKTITREEITGYEAFDGTRFLSAEECRKYENSAVCAAKAAAWHYYIEDRYSYDLFNTDEEYLIVFDVPDTKAYEIIRHWAELEGVCDVKGFTPEHIGKRVAFFQSWNDLYFNPYFATKEDMIALYMKEIEAMFADKEEPKAE